MLPVLLPMFELMPQAWDRDELRLLLTELCLYHAPLQHGFEVAWSLWTARSLSVDLPAEVANAVRKVDDDIVALVALDLKAQGLLPTFIPTLWASRMTEESLYSEHWLLAYEAYVHDWLPSKDGTDYVSKDDFFRILKAGDVKFYDVKEPWEDGYSDYSDGDDEYVIDEEEEEDDELDEDSEVNPIIVDPGVPIWTPFTPPTLASPFQPSPPPWVAQAQSGEPEDS